MENGMKLAERFGEELSKHGLDFLVDDMILVLPRVLAAQLLYVSTVAGLTPDSFALEHILAPQLVQYLDPGHGLLEAFIHDGAFSDATPARLVKSVSFTTDMISSMVVQAQREFDRACARREKADRDLSRLLAIEKALEDATEPQAA